MVRLKEFDQAAAGAFLVVIPQQFHKVAISETIFSWRTSTGTYSLDHFSRYCNIISAFCP